MIDQIFEIAEHALPDFLERIAKLSGKSVKLLGKPITPTFHGTVTRPIEINGSKFDIKGNRFVRVYHQVSVVAETPKIHGYTFIGTIDHQHAKGNVLRSVPGSQDLPIKYRTADSNCDHCNVLRRRNETYVLRCDADGSYKQIGSTCIRDFIGYDVTAFTETAKWLSGLEPSEDDGEGGWGGSVSRVIPLLGYLAHAHAMIRTKGWMSKGDAEVRMEMSTAARAIWNMFPLPGQRHLAVPLTDRDHAVALEARDWARNNTGRSQYEHNVSVVASEDYIESKETGIAASMIQALFRFQERELQRAERSVSLKDSKHIGTVGERLRGIAVKVYGYNSFTGSYGPTHIFRLRTPDNNVVVLFASSEKDFIIGDDLVLDGFVKRHDVYQDINQTIINRAKVISRSRNGQLVGANV